VVRGDRNSNAKAVTAMCRLAVNAHKQGEIFANMMKLQGLFNGSRRWRRWVGKVEEGGGGEGGVGAAAFNDERKN
jgi:hypothetical protein